MQQNRSSLILVEPDSQSRRHHLAERLFVRGPKVEVGEIKQRLKDIRHVSVDRMVFLVDGLRSSLAQQGDCQVYVADTASMAADYIAKVARPFKDIAINNSHTILEIEPELKRNGLTLINTYMEQFLKDGEAEAPQKYFWELPSIPQEMISESFVNTQVVEMGVPVESPLRNTVALLGVNAASQDGSMFFLQHSRNIGLLLGEASKLILLVAINRIVESWEEALFQTKCVGAFGTISQRLRLIIGQEQRDLLTHPDSSDGGTALSREVHIVLLDNGRSRVRESKFRDILYCIGCRACLRRCPTASVFPPEGKSYPGNYLWNFLSGGNRSLEFCIQCGSCKLECPAGIEIPRLILEAKADHRPNLWEGRTSYVMANFSSLMSLARPVAGLANAMLKQPAVKFVAEKAVGLSKERQLPPIQSRTFEQWFRSHRVPVSGKRILYYPGCTVNFNEPEIGKAVLRILEKTGHRVLIPKHSCCGTPRIVSGDLDGSRRAAKKLVEVLFPYVADGYEILVSCPSCGLTLRHEYRWLLNDSAALAVAEKTHNLSQYLWALRQTGGLNLAFKPVELSVVYHTPCHLRDQDDAGESIRLMSLVPRLSALSLERGCCGMSGTFGMKSKYYAKSVRIASPLIERIREVKPQLVATDCSLCAMQIKDGIIREGMDQEVWHPVRILDRFVV